MTLNHGIANLIRSFIDVKFNFYSSTSSLKSNIYSEFFLLLCQIFYYQQILKYSNCKLWAGRRVLSKSSLLAVFLLECCDVVSCVVLLQRIINIRMSQMDLQLIMLCEFTIEAFSWRTKSYNKSTI